MRHRSEHRGRTPWLMPPSSRFTVTDRAQKGVSEPGHRTLERRHDTQEPGADRRVGQSDALSARAGKPRQQRRRATLIAGIAFDGLIADKALDCSARVAELDGRGAKVVISQHPGRAQKLKIGLSIHQWRHLIETFFCKLTEFRRIAMRACKTDRSFEAMICLAAGVTTHNEAPKALITETQTFRQT